MIAEIWFAVNPNKPIVGELLPQIYADMYGREEMAGTVAAAYNKLWPGDKRRCAIFGQNYGQAWAIDFFGSRMGLPHALSGHQTISIGDRVTTLVNA